MGGRMRNMKYGICNAKTGTEAGRFGGTGAAGSGRTASRMSRRFFRLHAKDSVKFFSVVGSKKSRALKDPCIECGYAWKRFVESGTSLSRTGKSGGTRGGLAVKTFGENFRRRRERRNYLIASSRELSPSMNPGQLPEQRFPART